MKVNITQDNQKPFIPFTLEIIFENKDEVFDLYYALDDIKDGSGQKVITPIFEEVKKEHIKYFTQ